MALPPEVPPPPSLAPTPLPPLPPPPQAANSIAIAAATTDLLVLLTIIFGSKTYCRETGWHCANSHVHCGLSPDHDVGNRRQQEREREWLGSSIVYWQAPTLFHALMDDELVSPEERIWIEGLLKRKADARKAEPVAVNDARVNCIRAELERYGWMSMSGAAPSSGSKDELDGLLRRWVVTNDALPCPQAGR